MKKSQISLLPHPHSEAPRASGGMYRRLGRRKLQLLILISLMFFALVSFKVLSLTLVTNTDEHSNMEEEDFRLDYVSSELKAEEIFSDPLIISPPKLFDPDQAQVQVSNTGNLEQDMEIYSAEIVSFSPLSMVESVEMVEQVEDNDPIPIEIQERSLVNEPPQSKRDMGMTSTKATVILKTTIMTATSPPSNETQMACQLPKLDPFDPSIKHLIEEPVHITCPSNDFPLRLLSKTSLNSTQLLSERKHPFAPSLSDDKKLKRCFYNTITRGGEDPDDPDNGYTISVDRFPIPLVNSSISEIPPDHEYIIISCELNRSPPKRRVKKVKGHQGEELTNSTSSTTSKPEGDHDGDDDPNYKVMDLHLMIPKKPDVEARIQKYYEQLSKNKIKNGSTDDNDNLPLEEDERVNVVVFGIDAVSHMEFLRTMPKSYSFLMKNLSAVEMQVYNKVGDNTYPNLVAMLTPHNKTILEATCEDYYFFDKCPFIWKGYAESGFRTSFAEDSPWMSAFNYMKNGFIHPPTDYYLRPFLLAAEELIGSENTMNANLCYGPRLTFEVMLDYMSQMAGSMGHTKRYFQFIWATGLTHDELNYGRVGDPHLLSSLEWLQNGGYLNKTVLVLISDHGIRWGDIHEYLQGQLEERLPLLYFVIPPWFKEKYSRAYENLQLNQDRLTTPFDLHETLLDLLDLRRLNEKIILEKEVELTRADKEKRLPRGISQFLPIPLSRTCEMAEIEGHYCSCHRLQEMKTNHTEVEQAANFLVYKINEMVSSYPQCGYLTLVSIRHAHMIDFGLVETEGVEGNKGYELAVKTTPGNAVFAASVTKSEKGVWRKEVTGPIGRTNLYGNQSHCVSEKEMKLFCYCVDLLRNN